MRRQDPLDLEQELRASRPEPRPELVEQISARLRPWRPTRSSRSLRLAPLVALVVLLLVGLGAFGGVAIATNGEGGGEAVESAAGSDSGKLTRPAGDQYVNDVVVCHKPDGPNPQTLTIPDTALDAHLGHGDHTGACSSTGGVAGEVAGGGTAGGGSGGGTAGALSSGGTLPFTGLNLALVVVGGAALLGAGLLLRRGTGSRAG